MQVTPEEINGLLGRYARALEALGMGGESLSYRPGSKNAGEPYRLFHGRRQAPGTVGGLLGNTLSEAYRSLYAMALTLEDVAEFQRGQS